MPMYEFFCSECNTIYTFLSRRINTEKTPPCPKIPVHQLNRLVSRFSVSSGTAAAENGDDTSGDIPDLAIDENKMERALESLSSEAEHMDENDPRQTADLMRKLTDMTGLKLGEKMEDALSRMESGEDPEVIEQEIGDLSETDLFSVAATHRGTTGKRPPHRDETLYEM